MLPLVLVAMAALLNLIGAADERTAVTLMRTFAIGTMLPLLGLIAGTGVIAPEIDDGTIIHLLAKPISRPVIAQTKFVVAASMLALFAAVPTFVAAYLLVNLESGIAYGFALGALVGGIAYAAVFMLLGVLTRHAVTIGIVYALVWEGVVGNFVPGARRFSIQQGPVDRRPGVLLTVLLHRDHSRLRRTGPADHHRRRGRLGGRRLRVFSLTGDE